MKAASQDAPQAPAQGDRNTPTRMNILNVQVFA